MKNIVLNKEQENVMAKVFAWLKNTMELFFILGGYAGVGKTTMAMEIADKLVKAGQSVFFCAPTNKARDVIEQKLVAAQVNVDTVATVHGLIYTPNDKGGFDFNPEKLLKADVLICDECSMLTEQMMADLRIAGSTTNTRIILMGDDFQLPAVEKDRNPHKTPFQIVPKEYQTTLTKVMRQSGDSKILEYATALRATGIPAVPAASAADVEVAAIAQQMQQYVADLKSGIDATMIVFKNATRVALNRQVREKLYDESGRGKILPKETVIGYANTKHLSNGTVTKLPDGLTVLWQGNMTMGTSWMLSHGKGFPEYVVLLEGNDGSRWLVVPNTKQASIQPNWVPAQSFPEDWRDKDIQGHYKLSGEVNIVTFGYAITCHKSQGSQWDSVYVAEANTMGEKREQARWLYTAVTRAAKKLVVAPGRHPAAAWEHIAGAAAPFVGSADTEVAAPAQETVKPEAAASKPAVKTILASEIPAFKCSFFADVKAKNAVPAAETETVAAVVREEKAAAPKVEVSNMKPVYSVKADSKPKNEDHPEWHVAKEDVSFFEKMLGIRK